MLDQRGDRSIGIGPIRFDPLIDEFNAALT